MYILGIQGLYRVFYEEYRDYIGLYRGYIGIMEKKMETTLMGYIGILVYIDKAKPATQLALWLCPPLGLGLRV